MAETEQIDARILVWESETADLSLDEEARRPHCHSADRGRRFSASANKGL